MSASAGATFTRCSNSRTSAPLIRMSVRPTLAICGPSLASTAWAILIKGSPAYMTHGPDTPPHAASPLTLIRTAPSLGIVLVARPLPAIVERLSACSFWTNLRVRRRNVDPLAKRSIPVVGIPALPRDPRPDNRCRHDASTLCASYSDRPGLSRARPLRSTLCAGSTGASPARPPASGGAAWDTPTGRAARACSRSSSRRCPPGT